MKKILFAVLLIPSLVLAQSFPAPTFNSLILQNPLTPANGGTGATTSTGTGSAVLSNSPALTTPNLGTPSAVTLTYGTGLPASGIAAQAANTVLANATGSSASPTAFAMPSCSAAGNALRWTSGTGFICSTGNAMTNQPLSQFAATTSAQLMGVISDETGSGSLVFGTSPTINAPVFTGLVQLTGLSMQVTGAATDVQNALIARNASYSGGTFGFVNSALRVTDNVSSTAGTFESAFAAILNNSSTTNASENFAILGQANKTSSSVLGTWAGVFEAHENVATNNPGSPTIGIESDIYANGTDTGFNRVGLGIFTKSQDPTGVANQVGFGIDLVNNPTDTNPGNFATGIGFGRSGSPTQFTYGLDFTYATFPIGGATINMVAGQFMAFAPSRNFGYSASVLQYNTPSGVVFSIGDTGNTTVGGTLNVAGAMAAGALNGTPVGSGGASTGAFTTLSASGTANITGTASVGAATAAGNAPQWGQVLGGNNASYHSENGSRALGTSYTNSNGRPIFVTVQATSTAAAALVATVSGVAVAVSTNQATTGTPIGFSFIVPTGATYSVTVSGGTGTISNWYELF
jgi:hypothetical protein